MSQLACWLLTVVKATTNAAELFRGKTEVRLRCLVKAAPTVFSVFCLTLCDPPVGLLLSPGYSPAWDVCSLLGQCEGYGHLEARQELLAFSLTHCPPDNIHGLLAASSDLQSQVIEPSLLR